MKYKTVVKTMEPVLDEEGNQVDSEEIMYYLLHWGLTYEILIGIDGHQYPVTYTVGICQNIKTGDIKSFVPQDLTVVGKEVT